jgi:response regulator RpfG family c-di-GMP phosphodiesterase
VILITGEDSVADRVLGLESGADDYLVKPFALEEVAARVRTQIRARSAWEQEVDRAREHRRRLAATIEVLPRGAGLVAMATDLVDRLPRALDVDCAAILHFSHGTVQAIASTGALLATYPPTRALARTDAKDVLARSSSGAWLAAYDGMADSATAPVDLAYVPFRLGPTPMPTSG